MFFDVDIQSLWNANVCSNLQTWNGEYIPGWTGYLCANASAFWAGPGRASELGVVSQISSVPLMFSIGGVTGVKGEESSPPGDSYMEKKSQQNVSEYWNTSLIGLCHFTLKPYIRPAESTVSIVGVQYTQLYVNESYKLFMKELFLG